jgi:uncharacterized protein (DUF1800 family)
VNPVDAWSPLPKAMWTLSAARHLAARIGFSVRPDLVKQVHELGPQETIRATVGQRRPFPASSKSYGMQEEVAMAYRTIQATESAIEKQSLRRELREYSQEAYQGFAVDWYTFAREEANAPQEKLVSFFLDVWVVGFQGVRNPAQLIQYQDQIRNALGGTYPAMCHQLSQSVAMARYLNLDRNVKGKPNENLARELFELFILGQGNYTEADIKEAARAMTGYKVRRGTEVILNERQHDAGVKTIFGQKGRFKLEDVVRLCFEQPAAGRFLPKELARFYLTESPLSDDLVEPLAQLWRENNYSIPFLLQTFFSSRLFYEPQYRAALIKSPEHYYLGLTQDLGLDVFPSPRRTLQPIRQMGQAFFNPPNVRGWVGGRRWINASTLSARQRVAAMLTDGPKLNQLNADELAAMEVAVASGRGNFQIDFEAIAHFMGDNPDEAAIKLARLLYADPDPTLLARLIKAAGGRRLAPRERSRYWLMTALTAPPYHLC